MTTRDESPSTFDRVVALNIKRLRNERRWTAAELAEMLTQVLERRYTRSMMGDMEGRRERAVRWSEVVALSVIFDVPLWELVLPEKGERVNTRIPTSSDIIVRSDDERFVEIGELGDYVTVSLDRDGLAIRLFGLKENEIDSKVMKGKWDDRTLSRSVDALAIADALRPFIREAIREAQEDSES